MKDTIAQFPGRDRDVAAREAIDALEQAYAYFEPVAPRGTASTPAEGAAGTLAYYDAA